MEKITEKPSLNKVEKQGMNHESESNNNQDVQPKVENPKTEVKKRPSELTREMLKSHSQSVKELVKEGKFQTVNDAIVETMYRDKTHQEFKSYKEWKKEGFQVCKGEKAFALWGRPKEIANKNEEQKSTLENTSKEMTDETHEFFPVAYVFSNAQVHQREQEHTQVNKDKTIGELDSIRGKGRERNNEREK